MKALVIYDSIYGNTKIIAEAIAKELKKDTRAVAVTNFEPKMLTEVKLLIVGSPINGWRPAERMGKFLAELKPGQLKGIMASTFDTRINIFFHGDAAAKMAKSLERAGARLAGPPQAFFVKGKEGPLVDGEINKAIKWAKEIYASGFQGDIN